MSSAIGSPLDRADGPDKVTGAARYTAEVMLPNVTYAALVGLGTAYKIETDVLGRGQQNGTVWQGHLLLVGHGDPTLSSADLADLAAQVRAAGITRVLPQVDEGAVLYLQESGSHVGKRSEHLVVPVWHPHGRDGRRTRHLHDLDAALQLLGHGRLLRAGLSVHPGFHDRDGDRRLRDRAA